eukprot:GHVO01020400.1.p1 GENE.GHVO01020400.1~~GHVO01020400.1.p1  ORF type:complete len:105 (+),score=0.89 GHVO01020400.1:303-617(+)
MDLTWIKTFNVTGNIIIPPFPIPPERIASLYKGSTSIHHHYSDVGLPKSQELSTSANTEVFMLAQGSIVPDFRRLLGAVFFGNRLNFTQGFRTAVEVGSSLWSV